MKECLRCGQDANLSAIGAELKNFVCDMCRLDTATWDFQAIHLIQMEYEMPEPSSVTMTKGAIHASNQYC